VITSETLQEILIIYWVIFLSFILSLVTIFIVPVFMDWQFYIESEFFQRSGGILISFSIMGLIFDITSSSSGTKIESNDKVDKHKNIIDKVGKQRLIYHSYLAVVGT